VIDRSERSFFVCRLQRGEIVSPRKLKRHPARIAPGETEIHLTNVDFIVFTRFGPQAAR
jgi:hypothetical protein